MIKTVKNRLYVKFRYVLCTNYAQNDQYRSIYSTQINVRRHKSNKGAIINQ